jgi:hypothetical protein
LISEDSKMNDWSGGECGRLSLASPVLLLYQQGKKWDDAGNRPQAEARHVQISAVSLFITQSHQGRRATDGARRY